MNDIYQPTGSTLPVSFQAVPHEAWTGRFQSVPLRPEDAQELLDPLSKKQREVLGLAAVGLKNQEIGAELLIAESTVKSHMQAAGEKLGVGNRLGMRSVAYAGGLLLGAVETDQLPAVKNVLTKNGLGIEEVRIMSDHELTIDSFRFLTLAARGLSINNIATVFGMEPSILKSRSDILYKRLGVAGKKQACQQLGITP